VQTLLKIFETMPGLDIKEIPTDKTVQIVIVWVILKGEVILDLLPLILEGCAGL